MSSPRYDLRDHLSAYLLRCLVATLFIVFTFLAMDVFAGASLVSSLGASTFVVLAMPGARAGRTRAILGGYLLGTFFGAGFSLLAATPWALALGGAPALLRYAAGGLAVGATMFAMLVTDTGHPPAAGLALGYALDPWDLRSVVFVLAAGVLLALLKRLLRRPWLAID